MTIIQRHNGDVIDLEKAGIRTRDFIISSPSYNHHFGEIEGGLGVIDYGTSIGPREITVYFRATSVDIPDFSLLRDEIFNIFRTEESFYLVEERLKGKRWLVKVQDTFSIPQRSIFGNFEIAFIGIKGVSESIGTTQDIQSNGINANDNMWGFGMGLRSTSVEADQFDESLKYTHEVSPGVPFRVVNAGDIPIHPFEQYLKITIKNVVGSDGVLQIRNQTNQDYIRIEDNDLTSNDVIVFDGPNVTKNGLQYYRNTDRTFISLDENWNRFQIYFCESATIEFDFRFYYK